MFASWKIRKKLWLCLFVLAGTLCVLAASGVWGLYEYRALVIGISQRARELPIAIQLSLNVCQLRATAQHIAECHKARQFPGECFWRGMDIELHTHQFNNDFVSVRNTIDEYRRQLKKEESPARRPVHDLSDVRQELASLDRIDHVLHGIEQLKKKNSWSSVETFDTMQQQLDLLSGHAVELPSFLQERMTNFRDSVRIKYRTLIILTWTTTIIAGALLFVLGRLFYVWVLNPLRRLIHGSRFVAAGDFSHRIYLSSQDEMAELARAMNSMTSSFEETRDDLNRQVRMRVKEVARSEQLASVGFLAAGVAHEINNPLTTIAVCAESLEDMVDETIQRDDALPDDQHNENITTLRTYLRMIQDEAFRCKDITEGLLSFSRLGDVERQVCNLAELAHSVVDMISHVGKFKTKRIQLESPESILAKVQPQEFKQVLLNLITNALDSIDESGWVHVSLQPRDGWARLTVSDNGCGMTDEVKTHLFDPFFTRRRDGQGTGLGLSITYRIVYDHGGKITADSAGPGKGATIVVTLPLAAPVSDSHDSTGFPHAA